MTEEDKIVAAKGENVEATTKTEATTESQPEKKKTAAKK